MLVRKTNLSISVEFGFPASRQISTCVGKHVEHRYEIPIMLIAFKCVSVASDLGNHVLQSSTSVV
jgi:hypothetical protein